MFRAAFAVVLFAGAAIAAAPDLTLTTTGVGPITVGVNPDKMKRILGSKLPYDPARDHGCSVFTTKAMEPFGISFTIENSTLTRIGIDFYGTDPRPLTIKTESGIGLRSGEEDVLKAYSGRARIENNAGDPAWHTIFVDDPDQKHAMVFETNGKTVKSIRVGEYPSVAGRISCN